MGKDNTQSGKKHPRKTVRPTVQKIWQQDVHSVYQSVYVWTCEQWRCKENALVSALKAAQTEEEKVDLLEKASREARRANRQGRLARAKRQKKHQSPRDM